MIPKRPRLPTMNLGKSNPAAFLTTLPAGAHELPPTVDKLHADQEITNSPVAKTTRPREPGGHRAAERRARLHE